MKIEKKNWHENVMAAIACVKEEVKAADYAVRKAGGKEMSEGDKEVARLAMRYSDDIDKFMKDVDGLARKWQLIHDKIEHDKPKVQNVVLPKTIPNIKRGVKPKVQDVVLPKTIPDDTHRVKAKDKRKCRVKSFSVLFENGNEISGPTAKDTFVRTLKFFDLQKIADLGLSMNRAPFISKNRKDFAEYADVVPLQDGWFVSTTCSTETKVRAIQGIAQKLGRKIRVNIIPQADGDQKRIGKEPPTHNKARNKLRSIVRARNDDDFPYKVGKVVQVCFPVLFERNLISYRELQSLQKKESSKLFLTGGNAVIKINRGVDSDRYVRTPRGTDIARYYPEEKVSLRYNGQKYYLTSQFMAEGRSSVLQFLNGKGISRDEIISLVKRSEENRLGPFLPNV